MPTVTRLSIPDVLWVEPDVFTDARGTFFEAYNQDAFDRAIGSSPRFVQDNQSASKRHVLRGLHYQIEHPQGKLIRVVSGEIFDVCVDLRRSSPTLGKWVGTTISADGAQLWIPPGFAHGFLVLSERAQVLYKTTDYYTPSAERTLQWNDPALAIAWPITTPVITSPRDAAGTPLANADLFP